MQKILHYEIYLYFLVIEFPYQPINYIVYLNEENNL